MQIRDSEIIRLIEQIGEHYKSNIANRHLRPALLHLPLDNQSWDLIETLTEKSEQYQYQGFHLDELYRQIAAAARFIGLTRKELIPSLRIYLNVSGRVPDSDKVLREMAINNFPSNLKIFADMLNELYVKLVEIDKKASGGHTPLYAQMPELKDLGHHLVF